MAGFFKFLGDKFFIFSFLCLSFYFQNKILLQAISLDILYYLLASHLWNIHRLFQFYFWWDIQNQCKHYPQFSWVWHSTSLEKIVWHFVSLQVWHFVSLQNFVWHSASLHQFLWKSGVWHKSVWHKNIDHIMELGKQILTGVAPFKALAVVVCKFHVCLSTQCPYISQFLLLWWPYTTQPLLSLYSAPGEMQTYSKTGSQ